MVNLIEAIDVKASEFSDVLKMGRTQLQDAVPMTLGQEFHAWAVTLREEVKSIQRSRELLLEVNLGATAIGTGLNTPEGYPEAGSHQAGRSHRTTLCSGRRSCRSDFRLWCLCHALRNTQAYGDQAFQDL